MLHRRARSTRRCVREEQSPRPRPSTHHGALFIPEPHGLAFGSIAAMNEPRLRQLEHLDANLIGQLAELLIDCVEGGASVGFIMPLTLERAAAFWDRIGRSVEQGERALLVAEDETGVCGTVQLVLNMPENQPHRAELSKMLVHRRARRRGLGAMLMRAAENAARDAGRSLLVLDAVTAGDATRLYERLGWVRVGDIPAYALLPGGGLCSTTIYYRDLRARDDEPIESRRGRRIVT